MNVGDYDFWKNNKHTVLVYNNNCWGISKERSFFVGNIIRICLGENIKEIGLYGIWGRKYHIWFDSVYERLIDDYYFNEVKNYVEKEYRECNLENYKKWITNNFKWKFE